MNTVHSVFLALAERAIAAGWVVLGVILVRLWLKKVSRRGAAALWALVALRLVCPFSLPRTWRFLPAAKTAASATASASAGTQAAQTVNAILSPSFSRAAWQHSAQQQAAQSGAVTPATLSVSQILCIVWAVGVVAVLLYGVIRYVLLKRRVRVCMKLEKRLYQCDNIAVPFVLGIVNPRIYLPSSLPLSRLSPVLAHEYKHLRHGDFFWKPLAFVLAAVCWFHPLLWLAYVLFCRDVEFACDEAVIADGSQQKRDYSTALLECSLLASNASPAPSLAFGEGNIKKRIQAVLAYKKPGVAVSVLAVVLCVLFAACAMSAPVPPKTTVDSLEEWQAVFAPENFENVTITYMNAREHLNQSVKRNGDMLEIGDVNAGRITYVHVNGDTLEEKYLPIKAGEGFSKWEDYIRAYVQPQYDAEQWFEESTYDPEEQCYCLTDKGIMQTVDYKLYIENGRLVKAYSDLNTGSIVNQYTTLYEYGHTKVKMPKD